MLGKNIFRGDLNMFLPKTVYYEKESENYELGKELLQRYKDKGIQCIEIENHNNIEVMRKKQNSEFPQMKQNLIIGIRKHINLCQIIKHQIFGSIYIIWLYSNVFILLFGV